ncbi:MAG: DUF4302 domain-containing protein [Bacteroidaceae bacterium]|nr:DUF4302 domain-containing protein [Bacteroidaceae bacterium]
MMKKDIRYVAISVALAAITFAGCSRFQEDDFFDESTALRVTHFNEDLKSRLVKQSSEDNYGWVIQYFVRGTEEKDFEGFNLFGRFYADGKVTLASNHRFLRNGRANKYTECTSIYEMLSEDGPILAFNSWNDILTVFADPVDPSQAPSNLVSDGEGMSGDHNLIFQGYEGDNILFHGQRHFAGVRFVPCDRPWQDYMADTDALLNEITNSTITSYYVICGTDTLYFKNLRSGVVTYCERVNDPLFPSVFNCVFTPTGFCLQHKNSIGSTTFKDFTLAEDKSCLKSENDSVQVVPTWDTYIVNTRNTIWNFDQEEMTEEQKNLLAQIDVEFGKFNPNYSLAKVGLGRSTGSGAVRGLVFTFYTNAAKTKTNTAGLLLSTTRPAYGQMQISTTGDEATDRNFTNISSKCDLEALARQFAASLAGTYNIVPDSYFLPTGCELLAVGEGNKYTLKP